MLGGSWVGLLVAPLRVGVGVHPSNTDWMAVVDAWIAPHIARHLVVLALEYGVPILAAGVLAWFMRFRSSLSGAAQLQTLTAVYGLAALLLFRHLGYDFVFLVFPLFLDIRYRQQLAARWVLFGTMYFWFVEKFGDELHLNLKDWLLPFHFLLLVSMLGALFRIQHRVPAALDSAPVSAARIDFILQTTPTAQASMAPRTTVQEPPAATRRRSSPP
ncbi:MAG TPA: hypothetical protein VND90_13665 [Terracidiphilus sp.]|nr:hypothetical protein [Terracidiphilus sp.]